jgi:hypothetical protein
VRPKGAACHLFRLDSQTWTSRAFDLDALRAFDLDAVRAFDLDALRAFDLDALRALDPEAPRATPRYRDPERIQSVNSDQRLRLR